MSVSYTHLDVYKRQGLGGRCPPYQLKNFLIEMMYDCIDSVSYTHLDVYKRQGLASARFLASQYLKNPKPAAATMPHSQVPLPERMILAGSGLNSSKCCAI